ncbi:hypothetical protein QE382_002313 [Sphingobacterium zeae]|uniref:Mrr-like domain-containing protein n=1 Tax=Sphingobacterium zeae TaxID=1776859 RepID=A0ABU0U5U3_9SPHI|nr:hypothetical protein [Sphingobacterium zeae]MDQ1150329.1 hypothetical protein [Sphingobacterium zeae]
MKQQILKPENWQDFEELCKVLWGEIWDCSEIKKNGRAGQTQNGVDIYGIPRNESKYFGIQCKGKDEYTKSKLTENEICSEINKAKEFKPNLEKLYFATTANKDEKIEEFVRIKNVENLKQGFFEVHLFCWEDIVYLIEQNKRANDWYVKKQNFKTNFRVDVTLCNNKIHETFSPILIKNHIHYKFVEEKIISNGNFRIILNPKEKRKQRRYIDTEAQPVRYFITGKSINKSSCTFSIKLKNIGDLQLENFKLYLSFSDDCFRTEIVSKQMKFLDSSKYEYNLRWNQSTSDLEFTNSNQILVPNDEIISDKICLRPDIEFPFCLVIPWKLVSKDFMKTGLLYLEMNSRIEEKESVETYSSNFEDEIILENYTVSEE